MERFRVGIIGCGNIARIHLDALRSCQDAVLTAVCDILPNKAESLAAWNASDSDDGGAVRVFTDWREMIASGSVDCVHLCTPHFLHAEMAIAAMEAGIDVLTEKPMAISIADAERMVETADRTGRRLGVCFQNRYNRTSVRLRELVETGRAGAVRGGRAFVTWMRDETYYGSGAWRGTWKEEGGGVMINQAIHTLDLLQWMLGKPLSVKGSIDTRLLSGVIEVEDVAEALIGFEKGVRGLFYATNSYCMDATVQLEVVFEKAVARLEDGLSIRWADGTLETLGDRDEATGGKAYWGSGHKTLVANWYAHMRAGTPFPIDGRCAMPALKLVLGLYESAGTGMPVLL